MLWTNADTEAVTVTCLVCRPIIVRATGNSPLPMPISNIQSQAAAAGFTITPAGQDNGPFYDSQWCNTTKPTDPPCTGNAEFGIVDYGHRASPDVFLNSAYKTHGVWNASHYSNPAFDSAFTEFQSAVGVDAQKAACAKLEQISNDDTPIVIPYFYNYLSGHSKKFQGVRVSALGQMFLDQASQT